MTDSTWAFIFTAAVPTLTALVGMWINHGRFGEMSKRMDDLNISLSSHMSEMSKRIDDMRGDMLQHRTQIHSDIQMLIGWERERERGQQ